MEEKLTSLKRARARSLGTLTRARRRAFIIIDSGGSRTELRQILKELDLALDAVQSAHDHYTDHLKEDEEVSVAQKYIEDVDKQYSEAVGRIQEHLEARKDEAPSEASASSRQPNSRVSEMSEGARAREAEIQEHLKKLELAQTEKRLQMEQQEFELKRKRVLQEATDNHQRARLEAQLQKAAQDDLQWERRYDFDEKTEAAGVDKSETGETIKDNSAPNKNRIHSAGFSKSIPKVHLPQFGGNSLDWPQWFGLFQALVDSQECLSDTEKMVHLQSSVTGLAKKTIAGLMYSPDLYRSALEMLKERFGREKDIVRAHLSSLFSAPRLSGSNAASLEDLYTTVNCTVTVLQSLNCDGDLQSHENLQRVVEKLPPDLRREWSKYEIEMEPSCPTLATFSKWLGNQVKITLNCITPAPLVERRTPAKRVALTTGANQMECTCCGGAHHLVACSVFTSWSVDDRAQFVANRGLCFVCLQHGHLIRSCPLSKPCERDECTMRHHDLLHGSRRVVQRASTARGVQQPAQGARLFPRPENSQGEARQEADSHRTVAASFPEEDCETLLQIVRVRVHGSSGQSRDVFALLDPGSQTSLCTADVLTSLNLEGTQSNLCLQNVEGSGRPQTSLKTKLMVSPSDKPQHLIEVPEAFSVPRLNINPPQISTKQRSDWKHVSDLDIPDFKGVEIKLLLGANVLEAVLQQEARVGDPGQPVAVKTAFGWTLTGTVKGLVPGRHRQVMFVRRGVTEPDLTSTIEDWWTTESFGVKVEQSSAKSQDEARAEKMMKETTRLVEEGRYETGLLWKKDDIQLPDNRSVAIQRLQQLERGLLRQPEKAAMYEKVIQGYLDQGFAQKVTEAELMRYHPRRWYLPHHGVTNPHKPGKLRLVFDAASAYRGTSLNSELLSGPDMLLSLPGVLLRFREEAVAIVGDIEQMFHQVCVIPEDRPALSFLWRNLDQGKPPDTYNMTVAIFGAKCSPALASYVLCKTASDHKEDTDISRRAAATIHRNVYMDDLLKTEKTVADAKMMREEVTALAAKGGFRLTKWRSNSEEVLLDIPESERACQETERSAESVLGCPWNSVEDTLGIRSIEVDGSRRVTKRHVVSTVARLFDPLGLAAPYTLQAKLLVQRLWAQGLGWDEELKDCERRVWEDWVAEMRQLQYLVVPRCLHRNSEGGERHREMHIFCDASESAFGTVAFLKTGQEGEIDITFIAAKTRVAPLKQISIVRLELQAAVMASRLAEAIQRELTFETRVVFWSDSTVVLRYIRNESRRFHTFVANRVAEIRETSQPSQWRKVPTHENPADVCSRGQTASELLAGPGWLKGPDFLRRVESEWPDQSGTDTLNSSDPEVRVACATSASPNCASDDRLPDPVRFSSWLRYKRVVAWMTRFVRNFRVKHGCSDEEPSVGPLSAAELDSAESVIVRTVQSKYFESEIRILKERNSVLRSSKLQHVTPFLDDKGVLRVGGRLDNAPLEFVRRHPALLPSDDRVTYLIIADTHRQVLHSGMERTLTEVRLRFWPCRGRSLVKRVIHECRLCKRRRSRPQVPRMADLPVSRFDDKCAFSTTGVDYFGPMEVKKLRKTEKRYGVLFTCLATRAVHVEVAHSLDTDSFLLALRRFIARRGKPRRLLSDNGTNFVGGERELRESLAELEQSRLSDELSQRGIEWVFLPPGAPHMGGVWERLVGSVKRALSIVVGTSRLSDEVLHTVLTEVESMVNGRPLTYVSMDGRDPDPLTPNHLLLGCANANMSPGMFQEREVNSRKRWRQAQVIADDFWKRWRREYLPTLMTRSKWREEKRNLKTGDVVLMAEESAPRGFWPLARVTEVFPGSDGRVRSVRVKTAAGAVYHRPVTKVCLLEDREE